MTVDHEVAVADLVHVDGRQLGPLDHLAVDARPAVAKAWGRGQERGVEILALRRRSGRPDDLVDRYLLDAAVRATLATRRVQHVIDRREPPPAPGQRCADSPPERLEARCIEVLTCPN